MLLFYLYLPINLLHSFQRTQSHNISENKHFTSRRTLTFIAKILADFAVRYSEFVFTIVLLLCVLFYDLLNFTPSRRVSTNAVSATAAMVISTNRSLKQDIGFASGKGLPNPNCHCVYSSSAYQKNRNINATNDGIVKLLHLLSLNLMSMFV